MTIKDRDYGSWVDEELQHLLDNYIFQKNHFAETYSERAELNVEIQMIKQELIDRGKGE